MSDAEYPDAGASGAKSIDAFRTISEVAEALDVPQHVLRFWETRFSQIRPMKRTGGRRYYRPEDVDLVRAIRALLYGHGYTIRGVQRILKERGVRSVVAEYSGDPPTPRPVAGDLFDSAAPEEAVANGVSPRGSQDVLTAAAVSGVPDFWREEARAVVVELEDCLRLLRAARR